MKDEITYRKIKQMAEKYAEQYNLTKEYYDFAYQIYSDGLNDGRNAFRGVWSDMSTRPTEDTMIDLLHRGSKQRITNILYKHADPIEFMFTHWMYSPKDPF